MVTSRNNGRASDVVLCLDDIHKRFAGIRALHGVSVNLKRGKVLGITGPNGAGKTTLIDVATGRYAPDKGNVVLNGRSINGLSLESIGRLGLVRTFQEAVTPTELTVTDYLALACDSGAFSGVSPNFLRPKAANRYRHRTRLAASELLLQYGFAHCDDRLCGQYSAGEQKFFTLLRAFWRQPQVLLLDEPTSALNTALKRALIGLIRDFVKSGGAVAVISHDHNFIIDVADDVLYLRMGEGQSFPVEQFDDWLTHKHDGRKWRRSRIVDLNIKSHSAGNGNLLSVQNLEVTFYGKRLVKNICFDTRVSDVFGIIGPNGAGKSILLKSILGVVPKSGGSVHLKGRCLNMLKAHEAAEAGLGLVLQGARIPPRLTVSDAIRMTWARAEKRLSKDRASTSPAWRVLKTWDALLDKFPVLAVRKGVSAGFLSGGEQQLLAIAMAMARRPSVLMLDEPSVGLQDEVLRDLFCWLGELSAQGLATIVVEQDVEALLTIATTGVTIESGRLAQFWGTVANTLEAQSNHMSARLIEPSKVWKWAKGIEKKERQTQGD